MAYAKIGGLKFRIQIVKNLQSNKDDTELLGDINYYDQTIRLEKELPQQTKDMVLIHELMHGLFTLGIDRDLGANENFILTFSHALHALMMDNQKLFLEILNHKE